MTRTVVTLLVGVILLAVMDAHANCGPPPEYRVEIVDGSIEIHVIGDRENLECPVESGMLRENVDTEDVHLLADYCSDVQMLDGPYYLDECVPAGTYRYGWVDPIACVETNCDDPKFYIEVEAPGAADDCELSEGNPGPSPYEGAVPWEGSDGAEIACDYGGDEESGDSSDCSVAGVGRSTEPLLAFLMLAVGGIALLLARTRNMDPRRNASTTRPMATNGRKWE